MRVSRLFLSCLLTFSLILASAPVQALEPWVLYDNFSGTPLEFFLGKPIDPNKWQQSGDESTILDLAREIRWNRLHLLNRSYGDIIPPTEPPTPLGWKNNALRVQFPDPNAVTAIMIEGVVTALKLEGCGDSTDRVRALRASGFFFNSLYSEPPQFPSAVGDILASIHLETRGSYTDPPNVLRVIAYVSLCLDPGCNNDFTLFFRDLGPYKVGRRRRIKLLIQWDEENDRFIFQRDRQPEVFYEYPEVVFIPIPGWGEIRIDKLGPPGSPQKRLGVSNRVANCPSGPRPVAAVEALVNRVFVNQSAVP